MSSRLHSSKQCLPSQPSVTAFVLFSSNICYHQIQNRNVALRTVRLCEMLCVKEEKEGYGTTDLCSICQPSCWLPTNSSDAAKGQTGVWAGQDKSTALFSFYCIDMNTCAFNSCSFGPSLPASIDSRWLMWRISVIEWWGMSTQPLPKAASRKRGQGCSAAGIFNSPSAAHTADQVPVCPACPFMVAGDFLPLSSNPSPVTI